MTDLQDVSDIFRISKDALEFMKNAAAFLPKGETRDEAERKIQAAEEALHRADAKLAKDLDYKLCQCTFPPQIMLSTGRHPVHDKEIFECPRCKKQEPSDGDLRARRPSRLRRFGSTVFRISKDALEFMKNAAAFLPKGETRAARAGRSRTQDSSRRGSAAPSRREAGEGSRLQALPMHVSAADHAEYGATSRAR